MHQIKKPSATPAHALLTLMLLTACQSSVGLPRPDSAKPQTEAKPRQISASELAQLRQTHTVVPKPADDSSAKPDAAPAQAGEAAPGPDPEAEAVLSAFAGSEPLDSLLAPAGSLAGRDLKADGNFLLQLGEDQSMTLLSETWVRQSLASSIQASEDAEMQWQIYSDLYQQLARLEGLDAAAGQADDKTSSDQSTLPDKAAEADSDPSANFPDKESSAFQTQALVKLSPPEALKGQAAAAIQARSGELVSQLLAQLAKRSRPKLSFPDPEADEGLAATTVLYGDRTGYRASCAAGKPGGLYRNYAWATRNYMTVAKNQGPSRGTCPAFAMASILEMQVAQDEGRFVNFSEQDLFYHGKLSWTRNVNNVDGLTDPATWTNMLAAGYRPPFEREWSYNPSLSRSSLGNGMFRNSCATYPDACSETVHQGQTVCDNPANPDASCYYSNQGQASHHYRMPARQLNYWNLRDKEASLRYAMAMLDLGRGAMLGFRVPNSFRTPDANGFVSFSASETAAGGHAVHLSGYISNGTLAQILPNAPQGAGGGYLILKNSGGVCFGDAGYVYVPFDWAKQFVTNIAYFVN